MDSSAWVGDGSWYCSATETTDALSLLLDEGYIEGVLRRQYQPLLQPEFDEVLAAYYPKGFQFQVNGRVLERQSACGMDAGKLPVCLAKNGNRLPSAIRYEVSLHFLKISAAWRSAPSVKSSSTDGIGWGLCRLHGQNSRND